MLQTVSLNRRIRVFVSSTFRDMQVDRDVLVKKVFPQLRKLCESRAVTWTEVDLRWGITKEQANEGKVLPLCLAEIERSRPYFIGLLGERYGWVPERISPDLLEDEPWLKEHQKHSVTELEILHGVLNSPAMADRALFYFRDPAYVNKVDVAQRSDFVCENAESAENLTRLKDRIRTAHSQGKLKYPAHENYADPDALAELVLADFTRLINELYPENQVPNPLDQEANRHEEHARSRRDIYIPRPQLYEILNRHIESDNPPLVLIGESGCGKTALLANWVDLWRKAHPQDLIIQHYIGSTPDSTGWERIVTRILGELKRAFEIPDELPSAPDKLRGALDEWFVKSAGPRRIVLVLDGLNQLEDRDNAQELGWLPVRFIPNVRVLTSALPGQALDATQKRGWPTQKVELLNAAERIQVVIEYLRQGGRTASKQLLTAIERQPQTCNPLYLRAFLDEIRQFGRHEELPKEIEKYLSAPSPKELYAKIIERWIRDYPEARVDEALKLIWAARRGLAESELMDLLGQDGKPLPRRYWTPFYLAAERSLVVRSGLLNFAHDYLRSAVQERLVGDEEKQDDARLRLADYFEIQPVSERSCDELPWLLWKAKSYAKLRGCLLDIDRFLQMFERDKEEVRIYWVRLREEREMGKDYNKSFGAWCAQPGMQDIHISFAANNLGIFLDNAALHTEAEPLMKRALMIDEKSYGSNHPNVAKCLNNLAQLLQTTNRLAEAEPLMKRALMIDEKSYGPDHPTVATRLNNLARLLQITNRLAEAEPLIKRTLSIYEKSYGLDHPNVAVALTNLAILLQTTNRFAEAELLFRRALAIDEKRYGPDHPDVARDLNNLGQLLKTTNRLADAEPPTKRALSIYKKSYGPDHPDVARALITLVLLLKATNRFAEAEPLCRRALEIDEKCYYPDHPEVAKGLNCLAGLLYATNRFAEAEPLMKRALMIDEKSYGPDHPDVARDLNNLAALLQQTNRFAEAEPLCRRVLEFDEKCYFPDHPEVAKGLNNLAQLLQATNRFAEAEPLSRRRVEIFINFTKSTGHQHPHLQQAIKSYTQLLMAMGMNGKYVHQKLESLLEPYGMSLDNVGGGNQIAIQYKLNALIAELEANPNNENEIIKRVQRDDPELFAVVMKLIQKGR
jgi:tetratricopeptide (TPR) repeat protein